MALSGVFYGPWLGDGYHRILLEWSATQDAAKNTSTITAVLKWQSTGFALTSSTLKDVYIWIAGQQFSGKATAAIGAGATKTLLSASKEVSHGSGGDLSTIIKGTFNLNFNLGGTTYPSTTTGDDTITLDTIPRYAVITSIFASEITRNSFKLNYATDKAISNVMYSKDGSAWAPLPAGGVINGDANAVHNMRITVQASDSGLWTESGILPVTMVKTASPGSPGLVSKTCIEAVVNWSSSQTATEVQYKIGSGGWVSAGVFAARTSGSFIIPGLLPGTAYDIYIRVKDEVHGVFSDASTALLLTTVALSTVSSEVTMDLESPLTVALSRPDALLVHDLALEAYYDGAWNNVPLTATQSNLDTSGTLTPSVAANTTLFGKHPTTKQVSIRLKATVRWGAGGAVQGIVYKSGVANIVNANPSIAGVSYQDVNTAVQAILGNNQKILRNRSTLQVVVGLANAKKGALIQTYQVSIGGNEYSAAGAGLASETGKAITVGLVDQAGNQTAVLTVIDTRGNQVALSFTVQILDYLGPQILSAVPQRLNNYEAPSSLIAESRRYAVKPGAIDVNEIYFRYRVKENPSGVYGSWVTLSGVLGYLQGLWQTVDVEQYMADYPNDKSYTVELQISDKFTAWTSVILELPEGIALMRFMKDGIISGVDLDAQKGLSVGEDLNIAGVIHSTKPTGTAPLAIASTTLVPNLNADMIDGKHLSDLFLAIYPVGAIYISTIATSPATLFGGTWAAIGGRMLLGADGTYTAGSTGGAATVSLTEANLPAHKHKTPSVLVNAAGAGSSTPVPSGASYGFGYNAEYDTSSVGSGTAHNNMPPYLSVYMWKRTA